MYKKVLMVLTLLLTYVAGAQANDPRKNTGHPSLFASVDKWSIGGCAGNFDDVIAMFVAIGKGTKEATPRGGQLPLDVVAIQDKF